MQVLIQLTDPDPQINQPVVINPKRVVAITRMRRTWVPQSDRQVLAGARQQMGLPNLRVNLPMPEGIPAIGGDAVPEPEVQRITKVDLSTSGGVISVAVMETVSDVARLTLLALKHDREDQPGIYTINDLA